MNHDDIYYPLIQTPFGKAPLIGSTMTDEREREMVEKYPALREHDCKAVLGKKYLPVYIAPDYPRRERKGRYSY